MLTLPIRFVAVSLGVCASGLSALLLSPVSAQVPPAKPQLAIQNDFEPPPGQERPQRTGTGGSRDSGLCLQATATHQAPIVTVTQAQPANRVIQLELPATAAKQVEFSLSDQNGEGVYQISLAIDETPKTVKIPLPATIPALQPDQQYEWVVALVCQPDDRLKDQIFEGRVRWTAEQVAMPTPNPLK